jgi:cytochrome c peroxidase
VFQVYKTDNGFVQSASADLSLANNKFFEHTLHGPDVANSNGQACVSCHLPSDGFDLHVATIQKAFATTQGTDQLFRTNDTANRPDADVSSTDARRKAYSLFLAFGVVRIGKALPPPLPTVGFTVAPQNTARYGPLPNTADPQQPAGVAALSLFRRPLVNTNVNFDSSVLWDGRANIGNLRGQVKGAAKGLLLAGTISDADADNIAAFMTGVYTDQVRDDVAGPLSVRGAQGGVKNLLALASDPTRPCVFYVNPTTNTVQLTPFVAAVAATTCTPVTLDNPHTMTMYDAWLGLADTGSVNHARLSIARGQELFNTAVLHVPPDLQIPGVTGSVAHCVTCHATNNLGNNPDPTFFVRIGTDSIQILKQLSDADPLVTPLLNRVRQLPQYCLRPTSDPTPFTSVPCGRHVSDVLTTDPGHAMVSGMITDVGKFKPPILRDLNARSPYFHNGAAGSIEDLVNFYNARFQIGLTDDQKTDLGNFIDDAF